MLATAVTLAACNTPAPPLEVPDTTLDAQPASPQAPSAAALAIQKYYARVQNDLLVRGLLRTDGGGPDVPFSARNLTENFIRIALFDEYSNAGGSLVASPTKSRLRRWAQPIRMGVYFGERVPERKQQKDRAEILKYATRLSRLTNVPISVGRVEAANYQVLILSEDDRRASAPELKRLYPSIDHAAIDTIVNMPRSTLCLVFSFSEGDAANYTHSLAVIRAEHPDLIRQSCIHEELAQGLGLANDSPAARPSIFNDDEEFALLTHHDELLLKILYDRRLTTGMEEEEARPIVRQIAKELLGGPS